MDSTATSAGSRFHLFKELRARYLKRLENVAPRIAGAIEAGTASLDGEQRSRLRDDVHRIAGSGATFGFPVLSEAAFSAEDSLDLLIGGNEGCQAADLDLGTLLEVIEAALNAAATERRFDENHSKDEGAPNKHLSRVVIAEDDPSVSELLWIAFSRIGVDAEVAGDGVAAIASMKASRPDLVILDRGLPRMSGTSVVMEMQQQARLASVPTIVLSAKPASEWFRTQRVLYIQKPFMADLVVKEAVELFAATHENLQRKEQRQA